eukprot:3937256-Rhodomonas_salina.6
MRRHDTTVRMPDMRRHGMTATRLLHIDHDCMTGAVPFVAVLLRVLLFMEAMLPLMLRMPPLIAAILTSVVFGAQFDPRRLARFQNHFRGDCGFLDKSGVCRVVSNADSGMRVYSYEAGTSIFRRCSQYLHARELYLPIADEAKSAILLRARYAMPGTDAAYHATRTPQRAFLRTAQKVLLSYGQSPYGSATPCPVLT